jgi:hypothetical protein
MVTPSQATNIPPVNFRLSRACPHPGRRNDRQKALIGLMGLKTAVSGASAAGTSPVGTAVVSWAGSRVAQAQAASSKARTFERSGITRSGTPESERREWRERVGIEPTEAARGSSVAVLKTGQTTRPDPLPPNRSGARHPGKEQNRCTLAGFRIGELR